MNEPEVFDGETLANLVRTKCIRRQVKTRNFRRVFTESNSIFQAKAPAFNKDLPLLFSITTKPKPKVKQRYYLHVPFMVGKGKRSSGPHYEWHLQFNF